ncbi:MAG: hypothetical protein ACI8U4_000473 [Natronomonas sp.]|jgi:hypothetical protein
MPIYSMADDGHSEFDSLQERLEAADEIGGDTPLKATPTATTIADLLSIIDEQASSATIYTSSRTDAPLPRAATITVDAFPAVPAVAHVLGTAALDDIGYNPDSDTLRLGYHFD